MLEYTSCLFATVVMHAYERDVHMYQYIFSVITVLSVLNYTTRNPLVRIVDTVCAHLAYLFVIMETSKLVHSDNEWLLIFPAAVLVLWVLEDKEDILHAALHVIAVIGLHAYLYNLY
jgi:hypothetical protein